MTEEEAREAIKEQVDRKSFDRLERLAALVVAENERQNLIARSTIDAIWVRHILDSVQLLRWAEKANGVWLDIGTGGGFPGLAIAAVSSHRMVLTEPRTRRATFLADAAGCLGLSHVDVRAARVEAVGPIEAAIVSARAVAPIEKLFRSAAHCATMETRWLMPRGERHAADLHAARSQWKGVFHVEQSLSDPTSGVVIATGVAVR